jgi:hypothetical protein
VQLDRQSIERSDFPLVRRGYDPAAVGAHLQSLAVAAQELSQRVVSAGAEPSLGTAAATRVQGILEAAQTTAAEIEREAQRDAQRTRDEAAGELERARAHVETLARAAGALLAQVQTLDGEVGALALSLREESARTDSGQGDASQGEALSEQEPHGDVSGGDEAQRAPAAPEEPSLPVAVTAAGEPPASPPSVPQPPTVPPSAPLPRDEDLDGARLVALNMALSGESREQTDRYLADSFQLSDRAKLLDEVYAAVEG